MKKYAIVTAYLPSAQHLPNAVDKPGFQHVFNTRRNQKWQCSTRMA